MDMKGGSHAVGDSSMESGDWRSHLHADTRQLLVNKITDTLKRCLPFTGHEGLQELEKIAVRLEEKIYTAATSQSDYLRKISLEILKMETSSQNPMPNTLQSNSGAYSVNPSEGNTMGPNYSANQRQIPGRQQEITHQQQQQQQTQESIYLYQQQLQQIAKRKFQVQQGIIAPSMQQFQLAQKQQQQFIGQQKKLQQHLIDQHNNLSGMQQQHMVVQSSQSGGQQQLLGIQSGNSGIHHVMQFKIPVQQQNQQSSGTLLPTQVQQLQQQVMRNMMQGNVQQRLPTSGAFQQQNVIDQQQQQLFKQHILKASSTSLDSTAPRFNPNGGDWQEEVYQKIKAMKDLYLLDLNDLHQKVLDKLQQHDSLRQQLKKQLEKLKVFKTMLECFMEFLHIPKHNILPNHKDELSTYETQIVHVITSNRRKPAATQQPLPPPHMHSVQVPQQTHFKATSIGSEKSTATDKPLTDDHSFARKMLFFLEYFLVFLFICYINTVLIYIFIA